MANFHAKAELKLTAQAKILMSPILIRKWPHQMAHFFMGQNDHHLGYAINFDYVSSPPLLFNKLRMVGWVIVLSF